MLRIIPENHASSSTEHRICLEMRDKESPHTDRPMHLTKTYHLLGQYTHSLLGLFCQDLCKNKL